MERFWVYLGLCLHIMTDEEHKHTDEHLQSIAFAWNTTVSSVLEALPFEIMTGAKPCTITDGFVEVESSEPGSIEILAICVSVAAHTELATRNADFMQDVHTCALNEHRAKLKEMKVGRYVKILVPLGHQEAVWCRRCAKHIYTW